MLGLDDEPQAAAFEAAAASADGHLPRSCRRAGTGFEGGYFLYRFSDPTYSSPTPSFVPWRGTVLERQRARDRRLRRLRHLTRSLVGLSSPPAGARGLVFREGVARSPIHGARLRAGLLRRQRPAAVRARRVHFRHVLGRVHVHLDEASVGGRDGPADRRTTRRRGRAHRPHAQPAHLEPIAWPAVVAGGLPPICSKPLEPRIFGEARLFDDVVRGGRWILSRRDSKDADHDPALTIVATQHPGVFERHPLEPPEPARRTVSGQPALRRRTRGDQVRLRLHFPGADYEDEYGACRRYLPEEAEIGRSAPDASGPRGTSSLEDLVRRRVIISLPKPCDHCVAARVTKRHPRRRAAPPPPLQAFAPSDISAIPRGGAVCWSPSRVPTAPARPLSASCSRPGCNPRATTS